MVKHTLQSEFMRRKCKTVNIEFEQYIEKPLQFSAMEK